MVLTKLIRTQLKVFAILATFAVAMTVFVYARVPAMVGIGVYHVNVDFGDASGLYPKALVTYRGVKVGQVSDLHLSADGATAVLRIDNGVDIPADAVAELHSTSAIGEQYVDLVGGTGGAQLKDGATIPRDRAVEMPQITPVLDRLNALLESVPRRQTTRVLDQIGEGLGGTGRDLGGIIDASSSLLSTAQAQIDDTTSLISALRPVLSTQVAMAGHTGAYARSLDALTTQVARHDGELRQLFADGPAGLSAVTTTIDDVEPVLPTLLANLTTDAKVLNTYLPELKETLVMYPATIARLQQTVNPRASHGDVQLDLRTTFNDPPSCDTGYLPPAQRRDPSNTSVRKVNKLAHCQLADTAPPSARGARNLPCPNTAARGPLPSSCGLSFASARNLAARSTVAYDLSVGARNGSNAPAPSGPDAWKILLLAPLGLTP